jgi:hypothetical protein
VILQNWGKSKIMGAFHSMRAEYHAKPQGKQLISCACDYGKLTPHYLNTLEEAMITMKKLSGATAGHSKGSKRSRTAPITAIALKIENAKWTRSSRFIRVLGAGIQFRASRHNQDTISTIFHV